MAMRVFWWLQKGINNGEAVQRGRLFVVAVAESVTKPIRINEQSDATCPYPILHGI